jgi:hypothetical protein
MRYERGDVYPEYSTLRADPLGTRALYEALDSVDGYSASRGYTSLHRELSSAPDSLFYLGLNSYEIRSFDRDEVSQFDTFVKNGGRVIITLQAEKPIVTSPEDEKKDTEKEKREDKNAPPSGDKAPVEDKSEQDDNSQPQTQQEKYERDELRKSDDEDNIFHKKAKHPTKYQRSLAALWGFGWDVVVEKTTDTNKAGGADSAVTDESDSEKKPVVLAYRTPGAAAEETVPWNSATYFVRIEPQWQVLYNAKGNPVMMRRAWGKGEIIVATDSYFVSNEALRLDRRPALLRLLAGPPGRLLFDETHLGTQEQEGVMYLAEKYRLEGYLYGVLVVVLLLLWRNSAPLVPPRLDDKHARVGGTVSGKDSRSGLVNLLRRNIAAADILKTSYAEWKRQVTPGKSHLRERMAAMENILSTNSSGKADEIIASYHQIRQINDPNPTKTSYATKS